MHFQQGDRDVFAHSLRENLLRSVALVAGYRDTYRKVRTSRLHTYLPTRSIGGTVDFRPKNPSDPRFDGLAFISDAQFDAIRTNLLDKLSAVLEVISTGAPADEVYARWRDLCAPDLETAQRRRESLPQIEPPTFDVAEACGVVHLNSVVVERSQPAPDGPEVAVEFSLDANLKHQMGVVLESIVSRASRPIRLYVLCRGHGVEDFDRLAAQFPTVSFVWLPTDHVDYGRIVGMIKHITVATMDRLLLPDLLPDVKRIIHHDIDALCLADIAELWDIDLAGNPLAARDQPHPNFGSGYRALLRAATRLRGERAPASELVRRFTARHRFDFTVFNAGIMVLDLERMRADRFCREFLPYVERFGLNDQEVLNAYAGAQRADLARAWNAFPRMEVETDPKIMHWLGPIKPWSRPYVAGREAWRSAERDYLARVRRPVLTSR